MLKRKPLYLDLCTAELWEGVRCTLRAGHQGSHQRPASETSCAISWRSSTFPPPMPVRKSALPTFKKKPRGQTVEMIR